MSVKKVDRLLSLVLRHNPGKIGIELDGGGWVAVDILLKVLGENEKTKINLDDLKEIVRTNNKQRFSFSEDGKKIRANQGHSIDIDLGLIPVEPPEFLYHGTATKNLDSIFENGINKSSRQHVHLSDNLETATAVGKRHGKVIILKVESKIMFEKGFDFYLSENGVWLTDFISKDFINKV